MLVNLDDKTEKMLDLIIKSEFPDIGNYAVAIRKAIEYYYTNFIFLKQQEEAKE